LAGLQFWGFLGFIAFVPLKKLLLGATLTVGGAFLPDVPTKRASTTGSLNVNVSKVANVNLQGAPRYAVSAIGLLIVIAALWQGVSNFAG
jgi:hypothetical protein